MPRRVALVASGAEGAAARDWLAGCTGVVSHPAQTLDAIPWDRTELVWIHDHLPDVIPSLLAGWIHRGGRLLLSQRAARLVVDLGLEAVAPVPWSAAPGYLGFAAFGPHPLFDGLHQGALTSSGGSRGEWLGYAGAPPDGAAVAMLRDPDGIDPGRVVAWEYEHGDGGVLCLGACTALVDPDALAAHQVRRLLTNAVAGDGVPHSTRAGGSVWPRPGDPPPELPDFIPAPAEAWDEWTPSTSPLVTEWPGREARAWRLAGRRALVLGGTTGVTAVHVHPRQILSQAVLEVDGRIPEVVALRVAPDEVVRVLQAGEVELTERLGVAQDHGLVFWSVVADGPVALRLRWRTGLRRAWPYPPGGAPLVQVAEAGTACRVALPGEPGCCEFQALAGRVTAAVEGGEVLVEARGERLLRVVLAAGADPAELGRATGAFRRRRLRAFRQDRLLQARRTEERLAALDTPEPAIGQRFAWARVWLEATLAETPGLGRAPLLDAADCGRVRGSGYHAGHGALVARAALAVGNREIARDLLRFLARQQEPDGRIPAGLSPSGMADPLAPEATAAFIELTESWLAWTGDQSFLDGLDAMVRRARGRLGRGAAAEAPALPEDLPANGAAGPLAAVAIIRWGVERLWGVVPDAVRGRLAVAPALPPGWGEMSLRRLRVGETTLTLRLRRRPGRELLQLERLGGPPLRLEVRPRVPGALSVDEEPLGGSSAVFLLQERREVTVER